MVIDVRESQQEKALLPILVTLLGMVIEVRNLQPEKALFPIFITPFPIVTELSNSQSSKASSPILVTLLGMVIVVIESIFPHKLAGICSTLSPKTKVLILSLLLNGDPVKSAHCLAFQNTVESDGFG